MNIFLEGVRGEVNDFRYNGKEGFWIGFFRLSVFEDSEDVLVYVFDFLLFVIL